MREICYICRFYGLIFWPERAPSSEIVFRLHIQLIHYLMKGNFPSSIDNYFDWSVFVFLCFTLFLFCRENAVHWHNYSFLQFPYLWTIGFSLHHVGSVWSARSLVLVCCCVQCTLSFPRLISYAFVAKSPAVVFI